MKNSCFFQYDFLDSHSFFPRWRASRNIVIYDTLSTFSFFVFFYFSSKNDQILSKKWDPAKTSKNDPQKDPQSSQINEFLWSPLHLEPKWPPQKGFWTGRLFSVFSVAQKWAEKGDDPKKHSTCKIPSGGVPPRTGTFRRVNPPRGRVIIPTGTHLRRRSACGPANLSNY